MSNYRIEYFRIKKETFWLSLLIIFISLIVLFNTYNFDTGFWFDTPFLDEGYYIWHPHENDTCEQLQEKLDLFHPDGTNPVRFELLKAMFENRCEVILRR